MTAKAAKETLVLRRTYDAPPERVFRVWTDPVELRRWYSPSDDFPVLSVEVDLRIGGRSRFSFGPPGEEPYVEVDEYREIVPPRRLVFWMTLSRGGAVISETLVTIEFLDRGGRTEVVLTDEGPGAEEHASGWGPTLDHLTRALAS